MKILITGGCGYIGSKLAKYFLKNNWNVTIVDNLLYKQGIFVSDIINHERCLFSRMDIRSDKFLKIIPNYDVVIHLAAIVGAPACDKNVEESYSINVTATKNIVERLSPNQILVFPNTNSGYGFSQEEICTEESPINAVSNYGKQKDEAEKIVLQHPKTVVFRLATLFGPSYRHRLDLLVNTLVYEAVVNKHMSVFDGNYRRNFIHIDDVVSNFYRAAVYNVVYGQVYNLGHDHNNITKFELVEKIKQICPATIEINEEKTDPDTRNYNVSSQKAYTAGYNTSKDLDTGISELKKFYQNCFPEDTEELTFFMRNV